MPNYDGTGPFRDGRPGRGLGPCGRFGKAIGRGPGFGRGRCFGRGRQNSFRGGSKHWQNAAPWQESGTHPYNKASLEDEKQNLEEQLKWLNEQIAKLEDENK